MGPDGRRYTVQWIAAIIAEAKDSEREAQPLPKTCPACGTDLLCEHGIPFKDKCGRCEEATGAPSIEPLPAVPLRKLLGKVVRLTDGITKKEKVHSPLWFLGCEIYDEICAAYEHTLAAPAENSVSPATPELCSFCGLPRDEHAREAMDYTKLSVNPNNVTWKWNVEACPMGEQPFHSTSVFTAAAPASVSQDICPHKLPFYRCDVCEETARIPTVTKGELEDIN